LGGNLLLRKWIKENSEYIESLKEHSVTNGSVNMFMKKTTRALNG